jgi:hypothetical protein
MALLKQFGESPGFFPGFLSFCLPGLGQLYQRRFLTAAAGFLPFWICLALAPGHPWPLFLAVGFGAEAFRWGARQHPTNESAVSNEPAVRRRRTAFAVTAIVGFCFWAMLVSPAALPLKRQAIANAAAERLAAFYQGCARRLGQRPTSRAQCLEQGGQSVSELRDPWGGEFQYLATERGFELRSAGADRKAETADDFVYRYRFR